MKDKGATPGPQYDVKVDMLSKSWAVQDVSFAMAERKPLINVAASPGPVYKPTLLVGKRTPSYRFTTAKRF